MRTATRVMMALIACGLVSAVQASSDKQPKEKAKEKAEGKKEKEREKRVDDRQDRQERRINHGIQKGYLTPDEIGKLETQQKRIADLEGSFKSDGKLSRDEFKQLHEALDTASRCIWGEKHDTEGAQMPVYRLGKNIFAKDFLTAKMQNEDLPAAEAKALLRDFHRAITLKHKLATDDLGERKRAKLQDEFNDILNKYFDVRGPN